MAAPLKVEFHFDFGSPNAYLAELALPEIEQRTGVKFEYVPVLLGGIYKATGNMSPGESLRGIKNKPEYNALETQRFLRRHNITKFSVEPVLSGQHTDADARGRRGAISKVCSSLISVRPIITCGSSPRRWTIRRYSVRHSCPPVSISTASSPAPSRTT